MPQAIVDFQKYLKRSKARRKLVTKLILSGDLDLDEDEEEAEQVDEEDIEELRTKK